MSDTRPTLICWECRQDVTVAARLHEAGAENAALRDRCERTENTVKSIKALLGLAWNSTHGLIREIEIVIQAADAAKGE